MRLWKLTCDQLLISATGQPYAISFSAVCPVIEMLRLEADEKLFTLEKIKHIFQQFYFSDEALAKKKKSLKPQKGKEKKPEEKAIGNGR
jgi:hypothetical protein